VELELDHAAKVQENKLLMLKLKNFDSAKAVSAKHLDLASIDSSVYKDRR